jgi:uracil phosphoribosyltransferase
MLLAYEVTRDLALEMIDIETPLQPMKAPVLAGKKLVFAPILRAGVGFLDGMLSLVPSARVAHVGLYRDPKTLVAVEYYFKAPEDVEDRSCWCSTRCWRRRIRPIAAVDRLKEAGAKASLRVPARRTRGVEKFHATIPTSQSGQQRSTAT